jgi:DNA-binding CsgD family transcriptional regulator
LPCTRDTSTGCDYEIDEASHICIAIKRPSIGWASLSPTELEDVRLVVVAGFSNPEIGGRLLMSRGTVKTHVSHVYAKVGVANRTALATLAAAQPTAL